MNEKKNELTPKGETQINEIELYKRVSVIIKNRKYQAQSKAKQEINLMLGRFDSVLTQMYSVVSVLNTVGQFLCHWNKNWHGHILLPMKSNEAYNYVHDTAARYLCVVGCASKSHA